MPVDKALNIFVRNAVRVGIAPTVEVLPPLGDDPAEDTSEEQQNIFRSAGVAPTVRQTQDEDRADEVRRTRQARLPAGAGHSFAFGQFQPIAGTGFDGRALGPIGFPYTITDLYVTVADNSAAPAIDSVEFTILVGVNDDLSAASILSDLNIVDEARFPVGAIPRYAIETQGGQVTTFRIQPNTAILFGPTFLKAIVTATGAGDRPTLNLVIQETIPIPRFGALFLPPVGRRTFNSNTASPRPRSTRPPTPRGAVISVRQGGTIISQRTIAWESLRADLKRDWFNRQIGATPDPNITWLP